MPTTRKDGLVTLTIAIQTIVICAIFIVWSELFLQLTHKLQGQPPPYALCFSAFVLGMLATFWRVRHSLPLKGAWQWSNAFLLGAYQSFLVGCILSLVLFAFEQDSLSRSFVASFLGISFIILTISNKVLPKWLLVATSARNLKKRYLIIGGEDSIEALEDWVAEERALDTDFVGYLDANPQNARTAGIDHVGGPNELRRAIHEYNATHVVVLDMVNSKSWCQDIVSTIEASGCRLVIKNPLENLVERRLSHFSSENRLFFTLQREPLENPVNRIIKRVFDLAISIPVCLLVLPPLFLLVAVMQRKQAPGPILFKQKRYGRNREPFSILKFRSMYHDPDTSEKAERERALRQATRNDSRIYPFGSFLRKTSLDEFPQFINVLIGQMSIVGPRPHPVTLDEKYVYMIQSYASRHYVKPGITGLAQCKGLRGETALLELMSKRIQQDIAYLESWNPVLDAHILFKTFTQIFRSPNTAY
ncbi:sugar transferase [Pelagicoccus sp. SDUM812003]|uniref:sugar transferase n=1 Tax=Pelagicoccus sp. SDUM812003 TaxID=3041267 RepID=UPI00280F38BB|nr:sugar transferase [Pelagicoccus sp. SDUM812003]MDQ8204665.1 sugar transferase [Pelagicoccus sp. SDUM812003]